MRLVLVRVPGAEPIDTHRPVLKYRLGREVQVLDVHDTWAPPARCSHRCSREYSGATATSGFAARRLITSSAMRAPVTSSTGTDDHERLASSETAHASRVSTIPGTAGAHVVTL